MSDRLDELGESTTVVLVTFTDPDNLDDYRDTNSVPFPILIDPDRSAYRAYGLGRGSTLQPKPPGLDELNRLGLTP